MTTERWDVTNEGRVWQNGRDMATSYTLASYRECDIWTNARDINPADVCFGAPFALVFPYNFTGSINDCQLLIAGLSDRASYQVSTPYPGAILADVLPREQTDSISSDRWIFDASFFLRGVKFIDESYETPLSVNLAVTIGDSQSLVLRDAEHTGFAQHAGWATLGLGEAFNGDRCHVAVNRGLVRRIDTLFEGDDEPGSRVISTQSTTQIHSRPTPATVQSSVKQPLLNVIRRPRGASFRMA